MEKRGENIFVIIFHYFFFNFTPGKPLNAENQRQKVIESVKRSHTGSKCKVLLKVSVCGLRFSVDASRGSSELSTVLYGKTIPTFGGVSGRVGGDFWRNFRGFGRDVREIRGDLF